MNISLIVTLLFMALEVPTDEASMKKYYQQSIEESLGYSCQDLSLKTLIDSSDGIYIAKVVNEFVPTKIDVDKVRVQAQVKDGMSIQDAYITRGSELERQRYKVYEFEIIETIKGQKTGEVLYKLPRLQNDVEGEIVVYEKASTGNESSAQCWASPDFKIGEDYLIFPKLFLHPKGNIPTEAISKEELEEIKTFVQGIN